ncbi:lipid-transfer protein [Rhodococcus olei]|uniref:Lipid-transfer protein n=1 Tax=Rhodococcus olei TaxID=2161675 RepID=A0ABP8PSR9_9NOCA
MANISDRSSPRSPVCVVGVGQTDLSSRSGRSTTRLAFEAITLAARDAGIDPQDIDGVVPYPDGPSAEDVISMFQLPDVRFTATPHMGGASNAAGVRLAQIALETGEARYVVVFVARNGRSETPISHRVHGLAGQRLRSALEQVHGMDTPAQWYSLVCRRHMHEFGTDRKALGTVALTMRAHAQLNPAAQMHGRPLTMEQYLASPVIADPYLLLDCCLETDGAAAVILTTADRAADSASSPVALRASGEGHAQSPDDLANRVDVFETGLTKVAPRVFAAAGVEPCDIDVAMIYDCFTFEVIQQLEEAGFCGRGEGGDFVLDGHIGLDGSLPVNPHGGLLSEGHLAGMNHVVEAVRQLRGLGGARQVAGARLAAVTGWGGLGDGSMLILEGTNRQGGA